MRILFAGDTHYPHADPAAIDLFFQLTDMVRPHTVVLLGDIADCAQISSFLVDPSEMTGEALQAGLDRAKAFLTDLRALVGAGTEIVYLEGNHESRLASKYLRKHPEIAGLRALTIPSLLDLDALGITYISYNTPYRIGGIIAEHGDTVRQYAGATARTVLARRGLSGIMGHSHRASHYHHTTMAGQQEWIECGCLCRKDMDYLTSTANWQHAVTIGTTDDDTGQLHLELVTFHGQTACYGGRLYRA